MIHYHGTPITPNSAALTTIRNGHAFISFNRPDQLGLAIEVCQSFAVDNGAFSFWKSGEEKTDWRDYYDFVAELHRYPSFDFAIIPDVIEGSEKDNDALLDEWPWRCNKTKGVGCPVWHLHESLDRLLRLALEYPRIAFGSSGQYSVIGNTQWWHRVAEAMNVICDKKGRPITKIHGLRMLDIEIFSRLPFSSADSCNIAVSIGLDSKWKGTYTPMSKDVRAMIMRERVEEYQSPMFWSEQETQSLLF